MKIITKEKKFTVVDNGFIDDPNLSFKAKGLLLTILSKPNDWNITSDGMAVFAKDGRDSVRAAFNELVDYGYAYLNRFRDEKNHWQKEWFIYESSALNPQFKKTESPKPVNPSSESPSSEVPSPGNPALLVNTVEVNTIQVNTNKLNTNKENTDRLIDGKAGKPVVGNSIEDRVKNAVWFEGVRKKYNQVNFDGLVVDWLKDATEYLNKAHKTVNDSWLKQNLTGFIDRRISNPKANKGYSNPYTHQIINYKSLSEKQRQIIDRVYASLSASMNCATCLTMDDLTRAIFKLGDKHGFDTLEKVMPTLKLKRQGEWLRNEEDIISNFESVINQPTRFSIN